MARFDRGRDARTGFVGRAEFGRIESDVLVGNPLGDPAEREVPLYLPPGAPESAEGDLPLVVMLAGFTGRGHKYLDPHPWFRSVVQDYDRAVAAGTSPPAALLMPDCFTALGGSQYLDSSATGAYETHLMDELLPLALEQLPVDPARVSICGKSSGGFGALHLAMHHPGRFRSAASISGDCAFELSAGTEILACLRGLVAYDMDPARFLAEFRERPNLSGDGHAVINILAMSACYSPNPDSPLGLDLPMELMRGEILDEVWQRWIAFDPLRAAEHHVEALRGLELLHLECGLMDEFHLQWGLRRLVKRLTELDVPHRHLEHPGSHRGIDGRFADVLPALIRS